MKLNIAGLVVILCCTFNAAAQSEFASTNEFLKSVVKGEDQVTEAKGDLNGDGLADWAAVIHREKSGFGSTSQLYVLLRKREGGFRIAEKSLEEQIAGMGCCWTEDLRISRSSIYIQNNAKTAVTMEAATHQFKLYQGEWRLVGLRIYYIDHSKNLTTDTDMNLLTGAVVEKRHKGNRRPTIKRSNKNFGRHYLKDFDFFNGFGVD